MWKVVLLLAALTMSCGIFGVNGDKKQNPNCQKFKVIDVFQTFDDGALAQVHQRNGKGMVLFVSNKTDGFLYDDKQITVPTDKCFVLNGTYKYMTVATSDTPSTRKTVPVVEISDAYFNLGNE